MADRGDRAANELQAVASVNGSRLVGKAGLEECPVKPLAAAIAGEHAAGAVGAVGGWSEADDQEVGLRRAEVRHGTAPIIVVQKGPPLFGCDLPAILAQPRAALAGDDLLI